MSSGVNYGPKILTPTVRRRFLEAIRSGLTVGLASAYAGVSYANWRYLLGRAWESSERGVQNEYTDFVGEVEQAQAEFAMSRMDTITRHSNRSWLAAAWQLERRFPAEFGQKQALEIHGAAGEVVGQIDQAKLNDMSTEELLALESALKKLKGDGENYVLPGTGRTIDVVPVETRSDTSAAS